MASGASMGAETVAALDSVTKRFGAVTAVDDVSLAFAAGETHALLGENGAGKSTIVRLLAGVHQPDEGTVSIGGEAGVSGPGDAIERGVATIYQDRVLVPQLSVAENITLGREPAYGRSLVNRRAQARRAGEVLEDIGLEVDPGTLVADLSIAGQQLVAIAKALIGRVRLLIFDEPTAALTTRETEHLFQLIGRLKATGVAVIYITHRLHEVIEIADRVSVLKDGSLQGTLEPEGLTENAMVQLMIGRELGELFPTLPEPRPEVVLEVEDATDSDERFRDVSLTVRAGEIVCIAGLDGSRKVDVAAALAGDTRLRSGRMTLNGERYAPSSVKAAVDRGVAFIPGDRLREALFGNFSLRETITVSKLDRFSRFGVVQAGRERQEAGRLATALNVKGRLGDPILNLSGGNQQKALFARALFTTGRVLVLVEPTAGVDVGARAEIYSLIAGLAAEGAAIVVVSSDVTEMLGLGHRIVVMSEGVVTAELSGSEATEEAVVRAQLPVRDRRAYVHQQLAEEDQDG
jgi:rhamnose transport system ATP-binding protein